MVTERHLDFSKYLPPIKRVTITTEGNMEDSLKQLIVPKNKDAIKESLYQKKTGKNEMIWVL